MRLGYVHSLIDLFKTRAFTENRCSVYVFKRSSYVVVWSVGVLVTCEMVSTNMLVPLTKNYGIRRCGGMLVSFLFLGGMLLLFNDPIHDYL